MNTLYNMAAEKEKQESKKNMKYRRKRIALGEKNL